MTNFEVNASAPGKILWLGGYSVMERPNVGFVTTIDQHVHVIARSNTDNTVLINAPQLVPEIVRGVVDTKTGKITVEGAINFQVNLVRQMVRIKQSI
jgi:phosphomevalonate kinase